MRRYAAGDKSVVNYRQRGGETNSLSRYFVISFSKDI